MQKRGNRMQIYKLATHEALQVMRARIRSIRNSFAKPPVPKRLLLAPQDLKTADPTIAQDIYSGYYVFEGRSVKTEGQSPFLAAPPSLAWAEELYGFSWLRHLRAAGTALAQANARALVREFLEGMGYSKAYFANETQVVSRCLISFICQSPLILDGADHPFYMDFMQALGKMVRKLEYDVRYHSVPYRRLQAAIALCYAGLCCEGLETVLKKANRYLENELNNQILVDGGHISRNPRHLVDLLLDLLPLRQIYISRGQTILPSLQQTIDRMLPMLRLFRFPDGTLAHFNGMGITATDHLATLLMYDEVRAKPNLHTPYSGYARIEACTTVMVADIGGPPPTLSSAEACAGCLSFEFASGTSRLVVNCGIPYSASDALSLAARSTAAHSTLSPNHTPQFDFLNTKENKVSKKITSFLMKQIGPVILSAQPEVTCQRDESPHSTQIIASHDAYRDQYGFIHQRKWNLHNEGNTLQGEDTLIFDEGRKLEEPLTIRFHLAPDIRANIVPSGQTVIMELPNSEVWQFSCELHEPQLEESMFFSVTDGVRHTEQIVLYLFPEENPNILWRFDRIREAKNISQNINELDLEPLLQ